MKNVRKITALAVTAVFAIGIFAGCGSAAVNSGESANTTIKIGASPTPHCEILEKAKPILAEQGINLEIITIEGSDSPNIGLDEGSMDANFFQHQPYLDDFNKENGTDLVSVGAIHYEPFAIYAGKTKNLSDLPDGAIVAVPNDVSNEARGLLLLQKEGIIKLKDDVGVLATVQDIVENPKNLIIKEIAAQQLVNALPDVDIAIINGNYAIQGGLSIKDALAAESDQDIAAHTYANIVVVRKEDENNEAIRKLVDVLQSDTIRTFIEETYNGAVVPIK